MRTARVVLLAAALAGLTREAFAVEIIDRAQPRSIAPLFQKDFSSQPAPSPTLGSGQVPAPAASDALDEKFAQMLQKGGCAGILQSLSASQYEKVSPESLAVLAACEPPGKDPEKMFVYAERQAPGNDAILLLHARYRWRKQRVDAEELFVQLRNQTQNPKIKALASEYILEDVEPAVRTSHDFNYALSGQVGGLQQGNPQGLPSSDSQFGKNNSTAAAAQLGASVRKTAGAFTVGGDFLANSLTYWKTHDADLLAQDIDLIAERRVSDSSAIGVRPYGSFYMLNGAGYYSLYGLGLTGVMAGDQIDQWVQLSYFKDDYAASELRPESGSHFRFDWQGSLTKQPSLLPKLFFYVDRASAGVDQTNGNYIPYSCMTYAAGVAFDHVVHRYSVGFAVRGQWRKDVESTRLQDANGSFVSKRREDIRVVVRPSLTVPLAKSLDMYFYFESDSVASSLVATDGYDRNISDSTLGAVLRFSLSSY